MVYLDTHVVVWLYAGLVDRFHEGSRKIINENDVLISPVVRLELQYLYGIGRVTVDSASITSDLWQRLGLEVCNKPFDKVVTRAMTLSWTRDPFDRIIVAHADLDGDMLISKDQNILDHYSQAIW